MKRAISRFLKRRAVKDRIKGRRKFLPETKYEKAGSKNKLGDFDTDKFYDPKAKPSKKFWGKLGLGGATGAGGYAVGSKDDPAMKERKENQKPVTKSTKKKISKLKHRGQPALERAANEPGARDRPMRRLLKRHQDEARDLQKALKENDARYKADEIEKDPELRKKAADREHNKTAGSDANVEKIRKWLAGKAPSDWETKSVGALTGAERRALNRKTNAALDKISDEDFAKRFPGVDKAKLKSKREAGEQLDANERNAFDRIRVDTHASASKSEKKRKKSLASNKRAKAIEDLAAAEMKANPMLSTAAAHSRATAAYEREQNRNRPVPTVKNPTSKVRVRDTKKLREHINERAGKPKGGAVRIKVGERAGPIGFDPEKMKRNIAKIRGEDGTIQTARSRVKGTPKEEEHIANQRDAKRVVNRAKSIVRRRAKRAASDAKRNANLTQRNVDAKIAREKGKKKEAKEKREAEKLAKDIRDGLGRMKENRDDDPFNLANAIRLINLESRDKKNTAIGAGIGGVVGADQSRRYLRDVKLRHKQLRAGTNEKRFDGTRVLDRANQSDDFRDWARGYEDGELGKRKKVGLYSKKAPKGFRRHVATRALARFLTPIAVGGGIAYGTSKYKNSQKRTRKN